MLHSSSLLVFCLGTVKFSVGFRTKDCRFYWGRKVKNSPELSQNVPKCLKMSQNVLKCPKMSNSVASLSERTCFFFLQQAKTHASPLYGRRSQSPLHAPIFASLTSNIFQPDVSAFAGRDMSWEKMAHLATGRILCFSPSPILS